MFKAEDSSKTILIKIKEWANSNRFGASPVTDMQGVTNVIYVNVTPRERMVFTLDSQTCAKVAKGKSVVLNDAELQFIDKINFTLTEEHTADTGQEVSDWF